MKHELETIPVLDAFHRGAECTLCSLQDKSEQEYVRYYLTEAVMAPNIRILINETGFCGPHYSMLMNGGNRLGLALITHSHLCELRKKLNIGLEKKNKRTAYKRDIARLCTHLLQQESICLICKRIEERIERYTNVIIHLWSDDSKFRTQLKTSHGFCINHLGGLLKSAIKILKTPQLKNFITDLMVTERQSWDRHEKQLLNFISNFDYVKTNSISTETKQSLSKAIQKLCSSIDVPDKSL